MAFIFTILVKPNTYTIFKQKFCRVISPKIKPLGQNGWIYVGLPYKNNTQQLYA